jgi:hypothetical protein
MWSIYGIGREAGAAHEERFFAALRECDVIPRSANFVAQLDSFQYRFSRKIKKVTASQNDGIMMVKGGER